MTASRPSRAGLKQAIEAATQAITISTQPRALPRSISKTIDHTLLKLDATPEQIDTLCSEARQHELAVSLRVMHTEVRLT